MVINEFVEATNRLEKYFNKEYTSDQRAIMFDTLKQLSLAEYNRAVNYCIGNCKYLPKIADLKEGMAQIDHVQNREEIQFIKCDKCNDGFVRYFKNIKAGGKIIPYEFLALCTCENGLKQRSVNGYNFPSSAEIGI